MLADGRVQARQFPLEAVPGLGLGLLVLAAGRGRAGRSLYEPHASCTRRSSSWLGRLVVCGEGGHQGLLTTRDEPILPRDRIARNRQRFVQAVLWRADACGSMLDQPLAHAEFLVVDTETNGLAGDACELTEVGAVLVGGGELHERWESLVGVRAPLSRGIQRFTGITQEMVDDAPAAEVVLPELVEQLTAACSSATASPFDRRVLRQAFERAALAWPDPPVLCTVALARRLRPARPPAPAAAAGRVARASRSRSPTARSPTPRRARACSARCSRKLCAHAATMGDALAAAAAAAPGRDGARRRPTAAAARRAGASLAAARRLPACPTSPASTCSATPRASCSTSASRSRCARARGRTSRLVADDAPGPPRPRSSTTAPTESELGALVLESRLIRQLAPPGNVRLKHHGPLRLPALPVRHPVPGPRGRARARARATRVNVGPLRGRAAAVELLEQLNSLFGLRHCGRGLPRRQWPSAYGQMGRCLSPCLGDLDPNLYRRRLDEALALFTGRGDGGAALLAHLDARDARGRGRAALRARGVAAPPARAARGPARAPRRRRVRATHAAPAARPRAASRRPVARRRVLARRRAARRLGAAVGRRGPRGAHGAARCAGTDGAAGPADVPAGRGRRGADRRDVDGEPRGAVAARSTRARTPPRWRRSPRLTPMHWTDVLWARRRSRTARFSVAGVRARMPKPGHRHGCPSSASAAGRDVVPRDPVRPSAAGRRAASARAASAAACRTAARGERPAPRPPRAPSRPRPDLPDALPVERAQRRLRRTGAPGGPTAGWARRPPSRGPARASGTAAGRSRRAVLGAQRGLLDRGDGLRAASGPSS